MKIIGLSGTNGSGKDTIANWLVKNHGYYFASAGEMLKDELKSRGLPLERENQRQVSAEWRREHGLAVIVDKAVEWAKAAGYDKVVVGSLRNTGEVERIHELNGTMIWVDADPKTRYERITKVDRGRVEDRKTYEQFVAEQEAEMRWDGDPATLNLTGVKQMSDMHIDNDYTDINEFIQEIERRLKDVA